MEDINPFEAIFSLGESDKSAWLQSVSPPIYQTTNFSYPTVEELRKAFSNERQISIYTRGNNPTVRLVEQKLAAIQSTEDALLFGSGSAAIAAGVMTLVGAGDHVVCVRDCYSWTKTLLDPLLAKFGVSHTMVDGTDTAAIIAAFRPETKLLILESPNSFLFDIQDLEAAIGAAKSRGISVLADNSYGTPLNRKPAEFGADLIAHSATKFIGGHSDAVAGLLCGSRELLDRVFAGPYMTLGAALSPMNAWLLLRGLRTMPVRMEQSARTCQSVVSFLKKQPWVERVIWPHDLEHPQHSLHIKQCGPDISMFSIVLKSDDEQALESFFNHLKVFQMAASWGGYESLILPALIFNDPAKPKGLARVYVGLESSEMLIRDLERAGEAFVS
jgi:cystathionine beta-lyase/cystathionine gamma-synthase